jgi:DNA-binding transcriptional ArsR family regulator
MNNYSITEVDLKRLEKSILAPSNKENSMYLYTAFTYLTPNYSILLYMQELLKVSKKYHLKVILVLWDMSVLSHKYYRQMDKKISQKQYIDNLIKEIYSIAYSIGFDEGEISVYKSSDLWRRFVSFREENIFQDFYSTLSQLIVQDYALKYKAAYFIQMPMDLFFCHYFHKLYPEDFESKIEAIFIEKKRETIYSHTRKVMVDLGIVNYESPSFFILDNIPYLDYKGFEPEWNMSFIEIHQLISNLNPELEKIVKICNFLEIAKPENGIKSSQAHRYLSEKIFSYLQERKKFFNLVTKNEESRIISIDNKEFLYQLGGVLRSKIAVDILLQSDGKKNLSKIAKILKKSIPTLSTYVKKLKELKLVSVQEDGTIKRTFKGFKTNFELGF